MGNDIEAFLGGVLVAILAIFILLSVTGATPAKTERRIHQEAVNFGYGNWVVNTNSDGSVPRTQFQWVTNTVSK